MNQADIEDIASVIGDRFEYAKARYGLTWERPAFNFQLKGRVAGRAMLKGNVISINQELFVRNREEFLTQTIPHEVAHLGAYRAFNDRGHGRGWKRVMIDFGLEPRRCHNYDVSEVSSVRRTRRFAYFCGCRTHEIALNSHKKIGVGMIAVRCRLCKGNLKFIREIV